MLSALHKKTGCGCNRGWRGSLSPRHKPANFRINVATYSLLATIPHYGESAVIGEICTLNRLFATYQAHRVKKTPICGHITSPYFNIGKVRRSPYLLANRVNR